jgi:hypothetical protein
MKNRLPLGLAVGQVWEVNQSPVWGFGTYISDEGRYLQPGDRVIICDINNNRVSFISTDGSSIVMPKHSLIFGLSHEKPDYWADLGIGPGD